MAANLLFNATFVWVGIFQAPCITAPEGGLRIAVEVELCLAIIPSPGHCQMVPVAVRPVP